MKTNIFKYFLNLRKQLLHSMNDITVKLFWKKYPSNIRLESASICQLKCPICSTGKGYNKDNIIGWGYLRFSDFKNLIDSNHFIKKIEISNWGEIFLNPELKDIIKYSFEKGIYLKAGNGVNLNFVDDEIIECLVKYKFKYLSISIDGACNHTYKQYRVNGDFNKVMKNIEKINYYKNKFNSEYPILCWQFVIFGHNEHELPVARELAEKMNMRFKPKLNWDPSFSPILDKDFVRKESNLGVATRDEYKEKNIQDYKQPCNQLWTSPQINWDGKLLGCCVNRFIDFGNIFESGLLKCIRGEKYSYAKKMIMGLKPPKPDIACSHCPIFQKKHSDSI